MVSSIIFTNFSNGYVAEYVELDADGNLPSSYCQSWLLFPAENLWSPAVRGFLYILAMAYIFIGIAIGSDVFMSSIEVSDLYILNIHKGYFIINTTVAVIAIWFNKCRTTVV